MCLSFSILNNYNGKVIIQRTYIMSIECTFDTGFQPCMIYKTTCSKPQPLIVSPHIRSGNYLQQDSLNYCIEDA